MTAGDTSEWEDLFANELIPTVFTLIYEAWNRMRKPAADEGENATSLRLYVEMIRSKDRSRHMFLIRYEDVEIDADLSAETGRKDIVFFPPINDEGVYFCLEAKRLNAIVDGVRQSLASEYVKSGMQRFVDGKYSRQVRHGAMLGYVMDGDVGRAMKNVFNNIQKNHVALGMDPPGKWERSTVPTGDSHARETEHRRSSETSGFRIHHIFVAGASPA